MFVVNLEGYVEIISAVDFKFDRHNFNVSKKNISKPIEIKEQKLDASRENARNCQ